MRRWLFVCVVAGLLPSLAEAGTYWVSPTGAAVWGSCQSATPLSGTAACALATATSSVTAGDTVWMRGGSYDCGISGDGRNGTAGARITFAAYGSEVPQVRNTACTTYSGHYHGLLLFNSDYWVVRGIEFYLASSWYLMEIINGSSYNEIDHCVFNGGKSAATTRILDLWGGSPCVHNWLHDSTFEDIGQLTLDGTRVITTNGLSIGYDTDAASNYNTVENNLFQCAGHHLAEVYAHYQVFRNNRFNNASCLPNNTGQPTEYGADSNGLWSHRNIQIISAGSDDSRQLWEGNRFGPSGAAPENDGGDGMTITARSNLLRYNEVYGSLNNGILFKQGLPFPNASSDYNAFYNNTVFSSGRYHNTGALWDGYLFRWYANYVERTGNLIKNNILYNHNAGAGDWGWGTGNEEANNTMANNLCTDTRAGTCAVVGDPKFVSPGYTLTYSLTAPNLTLQASSPAINAGMALTTATGSGTLSTSLVVGNALYFQDGTWGSDLARSTFYADWIAIGTVSNTVQISSINYATNTIMLASAKTWVNGASVWLYKKSDGAVVLVGSAPDIGAHEYGIGSVSAPTGVRIR